MTPEQRAAARDAQIDSLRQERDEKERLLAAAQQQRMTAEYERDLAIDQLQDAQQREKEAVDRAEWAERAKKHTQDWYGSRWQRMSEWFRSPEIKDTKAAHDWFSIVANGGLMEDAPPVCFMASVNQARHLLEQSNKRISELEQALEVRRQEVERLKWLLDPTQPGAPGRRRRRKQNDAHGVVD